MSEEENQSVIEETQEAVAQPSETEQHDDVSNQAQEAEQKKRNDAEYNWAEMRRQMREQQEELEYLKKLNSEANKKTPEHEEEYGYSDDDLIEGKHLKNLQNEIKQLKSKLNQTESNSIEDRILYKYNDYYDVVNKENIEILEKNEPELAESLVHYPDDYKKRVAAYKLLKKIAVEKTSGDSLERRKAEENSKKPVSTNAVTKNSAIGNAHLFENGLTKELKAQLWKEMQDSKKAG